MSRSAYKLTPVIETDVCMGCGLCEKVCPTASIEMVWDFATFKRGAECTSCGECAKICPQEGIRMDWQWMTGSPLIGQWRDTPPVTGAAPKRRWLRDLLETLGLAKEMPQPAGESSPS